MSLFACRNCGVVENTALCGMVWEDVNGNLKRKLICSQCNPDIGKWHGIFPREDARAAGYLPIEGTQYVRKVA